LMTKKGYAIYNEIYCIERQNYTVGVNEKTYGLISYYIYSYLLPITAAFGMIGALICIIVFTRPQMRSSLNIFLAGLSFYDFILLSCSIVIYPMLTNCENNKVSSSCRVFAKFSLILYPFSLIAQTASVFTCVAITVDRFLAVKYPLRTIMWSTPSRAFAITISIGVISFIYKLPSFRETELDGCGFLMVSDMRRSKWYSTLYLTYSYLIFMLVIPWITMIILNTTIVRAVHKAYIIRRALTKQSVDEKERRCTIMAVVICIIFVLLNLPAGINFLIDMVDIKLDRNSAFGHLRVPISNLLVTINSACNLIIYSIFGRRFRRMCTKLFCSCLKKKNYQYLTQIAQQSEGNDVSKKFSNVLQQKVR
uniref:G_PROTEIN_RECEP_F1_2 domain-containing protein n=1 Tax=Rhabditophanes sp. KR3021 TaxID=114890 RepID=A0AC35TZH2_9BILA